MQTYNQILKKCTGKTNAEIENIIHSLDRQPDQRKFGVSAALYRRVLTERHQQAPEPAAVHHDRNTEPFDIQVSRKHVQLYRSAMERGKEFNLTHQDVRRLLSRKRCAYTGVELTKPNGDTMIPTDRTIDRIDASRGYVSDNVVAVSYAANQLKERVLESENGVLRHSLKQLKMMVETLEKVGFSG